MNQPYQDPPTQPKSPARSEVPIFERGGIKITNLRAVFNGKTYSVSNITSVEAQQFQPGYGCFVLGFIIIGVAFTGLGALRAIDGNFGMLLFGLVLFGAGFFVHRVIKPMFSVILSTASGEVKAYTSDNWPHIREIVDALNNAIVQKG